MEPLVSIIMPVYNSSKYLDLAINSALQQTYNNLELITIDDGSTDNSKSIIEKYMLSDSRIKYIYQSNKGIANARNTGINNSKGELIALLDADDMWLPNKLEVYIITIGNNAEIGLVHSDYDIIDKDGNTRNSIKNDPEFNSGYLFNNLVLRRSNIAAATAVFKRECVDKCGLFDDDINIMGVDDRDMWIRIAACYKVGYIDQVLAHWRKHGNNYSGNIDKMLNARIYLLNKLLVKKQIDIKLFKKAMARIYKDAGDIFLKTDRKLSRKYYVDSIRHYPLEMFSYINYIKTIFNCRADEF